MAYKAVYQHGGWRDIKLQDLALFGSAFLILIALSLQLFGGIPWTYSEGRRTGTITKFSEKGVFWKTKESEMVLGGLRPNSDGAMVANLWTFSCPDEDLAAKVQDACDTGRTVTVHYRQVLVRSLSKGSSDYHVTKVEYSDKE